MKIYQAETGKQVEIYNLPSNESVRSLKKLLASSTDTPVESQILLNKQGVKLEDDALISSYEQQNIYLFNRTTFISKQFTIPPVLQPFSLTLPQLSEVQFPTELSSAGAFTKHVQQFYHHIVIAENFVRAGKTRLESCLKSFQEQKIQMDAIEAATANLYGHSCHLGNLLETFRNRYNKQVKKFKMLLENFDKDLLYLKTKELHPKLKTSSRQTLLDCVPEKQLRLFAPKCGKELESFENRVSAGFKFAEEIEKSVNIEKNLQNIVDFESLQRLQAEAQNILEKEQTILASFKKDYASLREAIQTPQQQQHMSVKVLDTIMKSHEESISVLKACDENLKKAMVSYGESKIKLTQKLYEKLKSISEIQYNIKKLGKKLMTYISILNTLGNKFAHIELIHCLPGAYQLTLLEITRRGLFRRKLHAEVTQLEKNVQIIRDEEIALRKWFTKNIGRYLPPGLIRGLDENPPSYTLVCNTISESALPQIDSKEEYNKEDVQRLFSSTFSESDLSLYNDLHYENDLFHRIEQSSSKSGSALNDSKGLESQKAMYESTIRSLQERLQSIQQSTEMEDLKRIIEEKDKVIQDFRNQIEALELKLREKENVARIDKLEDLIKENAELKQKLSKANNDIKLMSKLQSIPTDNESISSVLKQKDEELENANKQLNSFQKEIERLQKENKDLQKTVQQKEQLRHETALNCAHSEKKLYTLSKEYEKLKKTSTAFSKTLQEIANLCQLKEIINENPSKDEEEIKEENLPQLVKTIEHLNKQLIRYSVKLSELQLRPNEMKITMKDFQITNYAIFVANERGHYEAVNKNCPNYFLSMDSVKSIVESSHDQTLVKYVIAKIYYIQQKIASKNSDNPYGLQAGTKYYVVDAAIT